MATAKSAPADSQAVPSSLADITAQLMGRVISGGGFAEKSGGGFRPDATAWAILALSREGVHGDSVEVARNALAARQREDGSITLSPDHPDVFWPTAPAVLAWQGSQRHREERDRGIRFFLDTSGVRIETEGESPFAHDLTLRGWPWTGNTASWVEPTSLALIALGAAGEKGHPRVDEAVLMLRDRQLEGGGWNYGNTVVFDQVLAPMAGPTGLALQALAGSVEEKDVAASLDYLESILPELRTPFSLSWAILGLGAWGRRPPRSERLTEESFTLQARYGGFGTTDLALLSLAHKSARIVFPVMSKASSPGNSGRSGRKGLTRRDFLTGSLAGGVLGLSGVALLRRMQRQTAATFIAKVPDYRSDIAGAIFGGMKELGVTEEEVAGKRILLKPNYVEIRPGAEHINTHPEVIRGAAEAFRRLGAAEVLVGEGSGHERDTLMILENTGLGDILQRERIPFVDLNSDSFFTVPNAGKFRRLKTLTFPATLRRVDMVVSVAKMKTHHWAGVTLSMKNLFGIMPGIVYGWPKNVLHHAGIGPSILDINATVKPHFAIVDGIVGMEGDGPIMGAPKKAGVIVMGRNLPAVDATCARVMGIDPQRVGYLAATENWLGTIDERYISQRGETVDSGRTTFSLSEKIPAQRALLKI